jgi:hypothetical protein
MFFFKDHFKIFVPSKHNPPPPPPVAFSRLILILRFCVCILFPSKLIYLSHLMPYKLTVYLESIHWTAVNVTCRPAAKVVWHWILVLESLVKSRVTLYGIRVSMGGERNEGIS